MLSYTMTPQDFDNIYTHSDQFYLQYIFLKRLFRFFGY